MSLFAPPNRDRVDGVFEVSAWSATGRRVRATEVTEETTEDATFAAEARKESTRLVNAGVYAIPDDTVYVDDGRKGILVRQRRPLHPVHRRSPKTLTTHRS